MKQMREPSGRSAIASTSRTERFSLSAIAIGQSSWASGVPSGQNSFQVTHHMSPIFGVRPAKLDAGAIEERDPAIGIGRVDGGRQRLQQIAELFFVGILALRGRHVPDGVLGQDILKIGFF